MEIYVHPTCTSCKKAEKQLRESGVDVMRRDYFRDRFTALELKDVFNRAGVSPFDVLSTRSNAYQELGLAGQDLSDDQLLQLMIEHPTLIKRPLLIGHGGSTTGYNADKIAALIAAER